MEKQEEVVHETMIQNPPEEMSVDNLLVEEVVAKKKRGDRGSRRKTKPEDPSETQQDQYYKLGMDSKYDVWVPPSDQSGDGKTSLNDKLGY